MSRWWSLFITLTGSKVAASIASLRNSVQLFGGGRRIIKLDSWDDPQERHIDSIANSPVRVASIGVGALVWAETRLGVAFMFACLKRWHTLFQYQIKGERVSTGVYGWDLDGYFFQLALSVISRWSKELRERENWHHLPIKRVNTIVHSQETFLAERLSTVHSCLISEPWFPCSHLQVGKKIKIKARQIEK